MQRCICTERFDYVMFQHHNEYVNEVLWTK